MNYLKPYLELIQIAFPDDVLSNEQWKYVDNKGYLFKNDNNDYCYLSSPDSSITEQVFIHIFKSNHTEPRKIEEDFLEYSILFSFTDIEKCKIFIKAYL